MALLEIENLSVDFPSRDNVMHAVEGVSLSLDAGDVLGIVGESGSGKSVTMMALMGLVAFPGRVTADKLRFDGHDLLALTAARAQPAHRQGPGDDLPGSDHQPEPVLHGRVPAGRDAASCTWA
jgi:ABC-type dipeptide/oligopeptide/nickel transport system ATPase component